MTSDVGGRASPGYRAGMRGGRLHNALVYFGLRDDPALLERLEAGPAIASRVALGAVAVVIGVALAFGVLALFGAPPPWSNPGGALAAAGGAAVGSAAWRRWRRRD
jgi:hypothetical protein